MVLRLSSFGCLPPSPRRKRCSDALSPLPSCKCHQPLRGRNEKKRCICSQASSDHWKPAKRRRTLYRGMRDIPVELLIIISTYMSDHDLRALATTSQPMCHSLLPEYLRRRGLVLKDACAGGSTVELRNLTGYASLGLWSIITRIFHPPKDMYCSIPYGAQEARSAIEFLIGFLCDPSNTCNLRDFHLSLRGSNPLLLTTGLIRMHRLFCTIPLTQLCFSGFGSGVYLPPPIALRSGAPCGPDTLTSLVIADDYTFAPGLVGTTMGALKHSPIKTLTVHMLSLNTSHWTTLLGELNMPFLEDVELEGDIPRPALIRFLIKHEGLKNIRIRENTPSDRAQPARLRCATFLPNLLTLHAPLIVCCDIVERASNPSRLYDLQVEVNRFHLNDPSFLRLLESLHRFQKLDHLGLRLVPSLSSVTQVGQDDHEWEEHPARELRQVHSLSFFRNRGRLSPGDVDTMCAYVRTFPMIKRVFAAVEGEEGEEGEETQLLDSLRKVKSTLCSVTILSGTLCRRWTADTVRI